MTHKAFISSKENILFSSPKNSQFRTNVIDDSSADNCMAGNTLILAQDGSLYSLEDLAGEYASELIVACIDKHGRLTTSRAHSFRIGQWTDHAYNITLASGLKLTTTDKHPLLSATNEWLLAEDLEFGSILRGATYDSRQKNPTLALDEVVHIHEIQLEEKVPMYDFTVDTHENLFVAHETETGISLIVAHNSALSYNLLDEQGS